MGPDAQFIGDTLSGCSPHSVTFTNLTANSSACVWDFSDNSANETGENAVHTFPSEVADYVVTLYAVNAAGCADSFAMVISLTDILIFYIPNSFTPDGDDYNETFKPVFTSGYDPFDFDLFIFNRWGEMIWESHDVDVGWDGTYGTNGREVQDGTYTWTRI